MVPHSLTKLWRLEIPHNDNSKKQGKPEIQWTPSQERMLFRFVADGVPWKHIPKCIKEPNFSPSLGTCRAHWHKMTEMQPSQIPISNPFGRKKKREQTLQAFKAYQVAQEKLVNATQVHVPTISPPKPSELSTVDSSTVQTTSAVDLPTPDLVFEGTTPGDPESIPTPSAHEVLFNFDHSQQSSSCIPFPDQVQADGSLNDSFKAGTKRHVPPQFDDDIDPILLSSAKQGSVLAHSQITSSPRTPSPILPNNVTNMEVNTLEPVQEEHVANNATKNQVAEVEDEMHVPRGYIDFLKRLTKSRWSLQSVISSVGTQAPPMPTFSPGSTFSIISQSSIPRLSTSIVSNLPTPTTFSSSHGQQLDLFSELRKPDATDSAVAQEIRRLLAGHRPDFIKQVIRARNSNNETLLEVALALGNISACEALLELGADVKALTSSGSTLRAFGRAAIRNTTTNQQYVAIGTCRAKIDSHVEQGSNGKMFKRPRDWVRRSKSIIFDNQQKEAPSLSRQTTPTKLQQGAVSYARADNHSLRSYGNSRYPWIEQHDMNFSSTFGHVSQQVSKQQISTPRIPVSRFSTTTVPHFDQGEIASLPTLPGFDPRYGYWELLSDNRKAFVLHPHINPGLSVQLAHNPRVSSPGRWDMHGHAPVSRPMTWAEPSQGSTTSTWRHGVLVEPLTSRPNVTTLSLDLHSKDHDQDSMSMPPLSTTIQVPSSAYENQSYHSQVDTLNHDLEDQMTGFLPQSGSLFGHPPSADTFESDVQDVLFDGVPDVSRSGNMDV